MEGEMHGDWKEDAQETIGIIEQQLTPVFEMVGNMLAAADERINRLEELVGNIVDGFGDAVNEHKKGELMGRLDPFHTDLDQLSQVYKDFHEGKDYGEELVRELMESGEEVTDEMIRGRIDQDKKRWGKYIGIPMDAEEEEEEGPEEEGEEEEPEEAFEGGTDSAMEKEYYDEGKEEGEEDERKEEDKREERKEDRKEERERGIGGGKKKKHRKEERNEKGRDGEKETIKMPHADTAERLRRAMNGG